MDLKRLEIFLQLPKRDRSAKRRKLLHFAASVEYVPEGTLKKSLSSLFIEGKAWQVTPEGEALYQRAQFILSYVAGLKRIFGKAGTRSPAWCRSGCARRASRWHTHSGPEPGIPDLRFRVWVMILNQSSNGTCRSGILTSRWSSFPCRTPTHAMLPVGAAGIRCRVWAGVPRPRHDPSALRTGKRR